MGAEKEEERECFIATVGPWRERVGPEKEEEEREREFHC